MEPFTVALGEDGYVHMALNGTLSDENFKALCIKVDEAKKLVKGESEKRGKPVGILFDLSNFTGTYNVSAMLAMKSLEEHNRPYTSKTAIYGGPTAAKVAAELTLALIHKDNLQIFDTREEALTWLKA